MTTRATVIGKIRKGLSVQGDDTTRQEAVAQRLAEKAANLIPDRAKLAAKEQVDLFCAMAEKAQASLAHLDGLSDVPVEIANYLREHNLAPMVRTGEDALLASLPWDTAPQLERNVGASDGSDPVGVSRAFAGVAESGTLVLKSGPDNPTTLNFLPDTHIVVVNASDIAGDYEAVWSRLREVSGAGGIPRTVNWVTGPSRSADIEQTLLLGAHGPRALHIIVVDE